MFTNCKAEFKFICPLRWEDLKDTDEAEVKFCETCRSPVLIATSAEAFEAMAKEGACIAVLVRRGDRRVAVFGGTRVTEYMKSPELEIESDEEL